MNLKSPCPPVVPQEERPASKRKTWAERIRPRRLGNVELHPIGLVCFLAWALPAVAFAYPGEALLQFGAQYIIAPLGIFAIVIALAASFFNPKAAAMAVFAAFLCAVLFFVIHSAGQITSVFQS
jgi:hypothetical protein